jgi:cell fate regulator YaaT (PSP1 superfamily)
MIRVIGVRFRPAGKLYYFDPNGYDIRLHDNVIVETVRGVEYGRVILAPTDVDDSKVVQPLKSVIRVATKEDDKRQADNHEKEKQAYQICLEKIRKHGLPMKLISAEYTFDNNKVLYYFTADGRIDFRELVRDLASVFKTRIELRQIGVRDETKILGGIGICGRPLCCQTFLTDFAPVSIKMAKEQNFSLNPMKISGVCGRLMCCLKNEESTYEWLNKKLPNVGEKVTLENGERGEVQSVNVLRQTVKVLITQEDGDTDIREYKASELKFRPKGRRGGKGGRSEDKAAEPEGESSAETMTERGDSSPEADGGAGRDGADRDSADRDGAGHRDGADRDGAGHRDGAADGAGHRDSAADGAGHRDGTAGGSGRSGAAQRSGQAGSGRNNAANGSGRSNTSKGSGKTGAGRNNGSGRGTGSGRNSDRDFSRNGGYGSSFSFGRNGGSGRSSGSGRGRNSARGNGAGGSKGAGRNSFSAGSGGKTDHYKGNQDQ